MENAWQRKKLLPNGDEYEYQKIKKKAYKQFKKYVELLNQPNQHKE